MTSRPRLSTASRALGAQGAKAPERARLLDRFADFPAPLRAAAGAADRTPPDGEWSSEQVVRHLIAVEMRVHQVRLLDVAVHDVPAWSWTEPGPWDGEPDLDLDGVLTRFAELRASTVARIRASTTMVGAGPASTPRTACSMWRACSGSRPTTTPSICGASRRASK